MARDSFAIGSVRVRAGFAREIELPVTRLVTGADVALPVRVIHGREPGPVVWINAATHGDEVNGVEVIRRVLAALSPRTLRGTLIAVPVVNVLGVMSGERYLPDRRDLNRSFPGSARGSLASRIAHLMMTEVVAKCDVGIDLHTGSDRRANWPHIRADLDDEKTRALARAFGTPLLLHARIRDGSLRQAARDQGACVLLYEGGENWRFDEYAIAPAVDGIRRVLAALDMIDPVDMVEMLPAECRSSAWVRARHTGFLVLDVDLGQQVHEGDRLGTLTNSFGRTLGVVRADHTGIVIGRTEAPLVNGGDAVMHIAHHEWDPLLPDNRITL